MFADITGTLESMGPIQNARSFESEFPVYPFVLVIYETLSRHNEEVGSQFLEIFMAVVLRYESLGVNKLIEVQ